MSDRLRDEDPARVRIERVVTAPSGGFVGPVKRSITIAAHATSISLEPVFWSALEAAAVARNLPLSALVAQIDVARIAAVDPPNLASAIRTWLFVSHQQHSRDIDENNSQYP